MTSHPQPNLITNLTAASSLASAQYQAVTLGSSGVAVASSGSIAIGILQNAPASGDVCEIATPGGGAKAIAGGTITKGDYLEVGSSGKLVKATGAAENVIAIAMESAVSNDVFSVLVSISRVGVTV